MARVKMVWIVEYGWSGGLIRSEAYRTKEEARARYESLPEHWYRHMYRTADIWRESERRGWTEVEYAEV